MSLPASSIEDAIDLPFWNVNVPSSQRTATCPDYLLYALDDNKDRMTLGTLDKDYCRQTWEQAKDFVRSGHLHLFQRQPSDLRRYREYCARIVREHGSIMAFVMKERLQWQDLTPRSPQAPFQDPSDYKILCNDWPYGVDVRIVHLVVWTKFSLTSDSPTSDAHPDDLRPKARVAITDFVARTFVSVCGADRVIWFKNWSSLKSIHAVEHFHVMLLDPPMEHVDRVTGGDVPLAVKIAKLDGNASRQG